MRRAPGASRESLFPAPGGVSATGRAVGGGKTRRATRRRTVCRLDRSGPGGGVPMAMQCSPAPGRAFFRVNSGSGGTSPAAAWPGIAPGERAEAGSRAAGHMLPVRHALDPVLPARRRTSASLAARAGAGGAGSVFAVDGRGPASCRPRSRSCRLNDAARMRGSQVARQPSALRMRPARTPERRRSEEGDVVRAGPMAAARVSQRVPARDPARRAPRVGGWARPRRRSRMPRTAMVAATTAPRIAAAGRRISARS